MFTRTITKPELVAGCEPEFEAYKIGDSECIELFEGARSSGANELLIPGINLVMGAALDTLSQPTVEAKLPREVNDRQLEAISCVKRVVKLMRSRQERPAFEAAHQQFYGGGTSRGERFRDHIPAFWRFARAPFMDVNTVAGGAARVLQAEGVSEEPHADIIARSTGLLLFARIDQDNIWEARAFFGLPYANQEHYLLRNDRAGVVVDFTTEAKARLASLQTERSGCPSRRIPSPVNRGESHLQGMWSDMVHFMIPPDGTASDGQLNYIRRAV
jgi:hypothetical protein